MRKRTSFFSDENKIDLKVKLIIKNLGQIVKMQT